MIYMIHQVKGPLTAMAAVSARVASSERGYAVPAAGAVQQSYLIGFVEADSAAAAVTALAEAGRVLGRYVAVPVDVFTAGVTVE